uniref:dCMP deaminase n=1 Tax=Globisporangium ultimum (strain ATCC 200006 / CBS 805.95 / DAOM BR144) TaxID=431595 RepID=K3X9Z3_GLOUD
MTEKKLSGRQIKDLFYTEVSTNEGGHEAATTFRCRCGKLRAQSLKHGYTNLTQHILMKHPEWITALMEDLNIIPRASVAHQPSPKEKSSGAGNMRALGSMIKHYREIRTKPAAGDSDNNSIASEPHVQQQQQQTAPSSPPVQRHIEDGELQRHQEQPSGTTMSINDVAVPLSASSMTANETRPSESSSSNGNSLSASSSSRQDANVHKRQDYLSWDNYFMSVAFLSAMRSKDPSTQVGACIVSPEKKIVGIGYNGFPNGCNDDELPWARSSASPLDTKYPYVCHAEMNAILNKNSTDVKGCTIYVALFPCNECAKLIIQSGISRVVYYSDKYNGDWKFVASRRLLDMAGVAYVQHQPQFSHLTIDFSSVD